MKKIAYICDRKKCENCNDYCHHTTDIEHAVNFQNLSDDVWIEKEEGGSFMKQYKVYRSLDEAKNDSFLEQLFRDGINHSLNRAVDGTQWVLVWDTNGRKLNTATLNKATLNKATLNTVKLS